MNRAVRRARRERAAALVACALCLAFARPAHGEGPPGAAPIDRTAARFYAPETGGTAYPRFVLQRTLAFEARLVAMAEQSEGIGQDYDDRDVREALDHHVAEEMLSNLADRLIADYPPDRRPTAAELARLEKEMTDALVERAGGQVRVDQAAAAEQLDEREVSAIFSRAALAAWYIDRALATVLHPSEEQLRDVFRTSANPYRGRRYAEVRDALNRWFIVERVRVTESAFLQGARSRVRVVVTR